MPLVAEACHESCSSPSRARAYNVVFTLERETLSELLLLLWLPLWSVAINIVPVIGLYDHCARLSSTRAQATLPDTMTDSPTQAFNDHSPSPYPSIVPVVLHPPTRYPGSHTLLTPSCYQHLTTQPVLRRTRPRCFDVGFPAACIPPCTSGAIGKAIARLASDERDLQQEKGVLA